MRFLPTPPRERVAIGVAMMTVGCNLGYVADGAAQAFTAGGLGGFGVAMVVKALLKLRRDAQTAPFQER